MIITARQCPLCMEKSAGEIESLFWTRNLWFTLCNYTVKSNLHYHIVIMNTSALNSLIYLTLGGESYPKLEIKDGVVELWKDSFGPIYMDDKIDVLDDDKLQELFNILKAVEIFQ